MLNIELSDILATTDPLKRALVTMLEMIPEYGWRVGQERTVVGEDRLTAHKMIVYAARRSETPHVRVLRMLLQALLNLDEHEVDVVGIFPEMVTLRVGSQWHLDNGTPVAGFSGDAGSYEVVLMENGGRCTCKFAQHHDSSSPSEVTPFGYQSTGNSPMCAHQAVARIFWTYYAAKYGGPVWTPTQEAKDDE